MIEVPNWGREDLPKLCKVLGFTQGAEIGVWRGEFSEMFLKLGIFMFCVDAWEPYSGYYDFQRKSTLDASYEVAKETLSKYNCKIIKAFSAEAAKQFADEELDFVYIDANHTYEGLRDDLQLWVPKVRKGGMVAGHDFDPLRTHNQIQRALFEYVDEHRITPLFVLGRHEKVEGETRDLTRSWMWIK